jgi:hypothetical protein
VRGITQQHLGEEGRGWVGQGELSRAGLRGGQHGWMIVSEPLHCTAADIVTLTMPDAAATLCVVFAR